MPVKDFAAGNVLGAAVDDVNVAKRVACKKVKVLAEVKAGFVVLVDAQGEADLGVKVCFGAQFAGEDESDGFSSFDVVFVCFNALRLFVLKR